MKRKRVLSILLISLAVLIVAGVVWFVWLFFYWGPRALEAEHIMIRTVRYIGLGLPDEFYDEIRSLPDGYIQLSELKTKLPKDASKETWGMIGPMEFRRFSGFLYVKKEGRFLCVAVTTFPPERNALYPQHGRMAKCFELIPEEGDPHGLEADRQNLIRFDLLPEDGKVVWTEDWDIDPYELLSHGIRFN